MIATKVSITRTALDAALDAADAPVLSGQTHSHRLSVTDGAGTYQTCLALEVRHITDLTVFLVALFRALPPEHADALADNTQQTGAAICYWPGIVLVDDDDVPEPTEEQRINSAVAARLEGYRQLVTP